MMKKILFALCALVAMSPAAAQNTNGTWSSGSATLPVWDTSGIVGNATAQTCTTGEAFTAAQGGCPPAVASEPAAIDESTNYTRTQWYAVLPAGTCIETAPADPHFGEDTGCRPWHGEDKIRLPCGFSHFAKKDPLLYPGSLVGSMLHDHTWFGNENIDENSTYATLRASPKSTCAGGPLASSGYWIPTELYEPTTGVVFRAIPEGLEAYYNNDPRESRTLVRLLRGLTVIGGVSPSDPTNSARKAELEAQPPAGAGTHWTLGTVNGDGFLGYKCVRRSDNAIIALANGDTFTLSWLNVDGSDPWNGACEGSGFQIWDYLQMPQCWNGKDFTSPNGRDQWRYAVSYNGVAYCPRGWWKTPQLTVIHFYPAYTHARRAKSYLSSDRMSADPMMWLLPGTTRHADWMMGWDDFIFQKGEFECMGLTINGVERVGGTGTLALGRTCATGFFAANTSLLMDASPNTALSRNPIVSQPNLGAAASKLQYSKALSGSGKVGAHATH